MALTTEVIPFQGWPNVLKVSNGTAELLITLDVGPRILSYRRPGSVNPLNIYADQAGGVNEPQWKNRGGHRLWLSPESPDFSYFPDNRPLTWKRLGESGVRLSPLPEEGTGFQKEIDLVFPGTDGRINVIHRLIRTGSTPRRAAAWALSVMAAGGTALIPQPAFGEHPRDLLPNRRLILWPYSDLADPRFGFGRRFYILRQDESRGPTKLGMALTTGWAGYLLQGTLFRKRFAWLPDAEFPDDGCNFEAFTNKRMLELESVGPLKDFNPGDRSEWIEEWNLDAGLPAFDLAREDDFAAAVAALPSWPAQHFPACQP